MRFPASVFANCKDVILQREAINSTSQSPASLAYFAVESMRSLSSCWRSWRCSRDSLAFSVSNASVFEICAVSSTLARRDSVSCRLISEDCSVSFDFEELWICSRSHSLPLMSHAARFFLVCSSAETVVCGFSCSFVLVCGLVVVCGGLRGALSLLIGLAAGFAVRREGCADAAESSLRLMFVVTTVKSFLCTDGGGSVMLLLMALCAEFSGESISVEYSADSISVESVFAESVFVECSGESVLELCAAIDGRVGSLDGSLQPCIWSEFEAQPTDTNLTLQTREK